MNEYYNLNADGTVNITDAGSKFINKYKILQATSSDNHIIALAEALKKEGLNKNNAISAIIDMKLTDGYGKPYTKERISKLINGDYSNNSVEPIHKEETNNNKINKTSELVYNYRDNPKEYSKNLINLIVELREKGEIFDSIAQELNDLGIKTVTGRRFSGSSVNNIYNNKDRLLFNANNNLSNRYFKYKSTHQAVDIIIKNSGNLSNIPIAKILNEQNIRTYAGKPYTAQDINAKKYEIRVGRHGKEWQKALLAQESIFRNKIYSFFDKLPRNIELDANAIRNEMDIELSPSEVGQYLLLYGKEKSLDIVRYKITRKHILKYRIIDTSNNQ